MIDLIIYAIPAFVFLLALELLSFKYAARRGAGRLRGARHPHQPLDGRRQRRHQRGLETRRPRHLRRPLRADPAADAGRRVVDLRAALLRRRPRLLLVPPRPPRGARLLGEPRRPPLLPALQPLDRAAPDLDADDGAALLGAAGAARLRPLDDPHAAGDQPHLPVLDPHRADPEAAGAGSSSSSTRPRTTASTTAPTRSTSTATTAAS